MGGSAVGCRVNGQMAFCSGCVCVCACVGACGCVWQLLFES